MGALRGLLEVGALRFLLAVGTIARGGMLENLSPPHRF